MAGAGANPRAGTGAGTGGSTAAACLSVEQQHCSAIYCMGMQRVTLTELPSYIQCSPRNSNRFTTNFPKFNLSEFPFIATIQNSKWIFPNAS